MVRRELIDVGTGRRYVENIPGHASRLHSLPRREPKGRPQPTARTGRRTAANLGWIGLLLLCSGALGLFCVLYTQAEHLEALLVCITCLGAMMLGVCTMGLRSMEPPLRRL